MCPLVKSIYIVDDGSSKAVKAELEVISRFDSRAKLILNDTWQGAAHCRNQGASRAKTNWLLFLDDDDQLSQGYLAAMRPLVAAHPLVQVWIPNFQKEKSRILAPVPLKDVCVRNTVGGCSGLLIRASLFSEISGFDERLPAMQDWDLWIRLIERQALYYSGVEGVVYDSDSTKKITHNLKAKYRGLRRLYFKHFDARTQSVRRQHLVRVWALRQLLEPSGPRLFTCIMRILTWPKATIYYLKWYKFRSNRYTYNLCNPQQITQ
ncbi:MAG: GalNAc(5)-diNAcBac-PP-undecaprenol beta-1,3-glucosyltransferase [Opitutia bacterium UBA7350]|nr:MAG: GalNAc(5)-diNAcBac-PP-undecaprenol beta-1,3-glucosyltransferase [Opitutae bacterium UBA7350]